MRNPSPYGLPQYLTEDRRNARAATVAAQRRQYEFARDESWSERNTSPIADPSLPPPLQGDPGDGFRLPPFIAKLPRDADFSPRKKVEFLAHKLQGKLNTALMFDRVRRVADYGKMYPAIPRPAVAINERWRDDGEFGRQRLAGVNPMQLRALSRRGDTGALPLSEPIADACRAELKRRFRKITLDDLARKGRLFETDYAVLAHPLIQKHVKPGRHLAAPRCVYAYTHDLGLQPLAMQLWPDGREGENPIYTPEDDRWAWEMAKWHAQAADAALHEAIYHLFETHLVTETLAISLMRTVHPDHPVAQLYAPHLRATLAINDLARRDMLSPDKAIDVAISCGAAGALNGARLWYNKTGWSWEKRRLADELEARGVGDENALPSYPYRDDARAMWRILADYVEGTMSSFYDEDRKVAEDPELRAFTAEASASLTGFPARLVTRQQLFVTLTDMVFRASAQHSAVNNGQFDMYGWVPNAPGAMHAPPPTRRIYTEDEAVAGLPRGAGVSAQLIMAWVLSEPTHYGLLGLGDVPAFSADVSPRARGAVATARRRLAQQVEHIASRNASLAVPYLYLDPRNVEASTGT